MTNIRNDIAALIRQVDGKNELSPSELGREVVDFLRDRGLIDGYDHLAIEVEDFVYDKTIGASVGHPKPMGADAFADAIVDRFNLDQENS